MKCGHGKINYKNGDVFEGEFNQNEKNGNGKYQTNKGVIFEGIFENGLASDE